MLRNDGYRLALRGGHVTEHLPGGYSGNREHLWRWTCDPARPGGYGNGVLPTEIAVRQDSALRFSDVAGTVSCCSGNLVNDPDGFTSWATDIPAWPRYLLFVQLIWVYFSGGHNKTGLEWTPSGGFTALANAVA